MLFSQYDSWENLRSRIIHWQVIALLFLTHPQPFGQHWTITRAFLPQVYLRSALTVWAQALQAISVALGTGPMP